MSIFRIPRIFPKLLTSPRAIQVCMILILKSHEVFGGQQNEVLCKYNEMPCESQLSLLTSLGPHHYLESSLRAILWRSVITL